MQFSLVDNWKKFQKITKEYGLYHAILKFFYWFKNTILAEVFDKKDIISKMSFVYLKENPACLSSNEELRKTMNWVIPGYGKGSGGHLNIVRFIYNLEKLGYKCNIVIACDVPNVNKKQAKTEICNWFFPISGEVFLSTEGIPDVEFTVATEWRTAYFVRNIGRTVKKLYFVQDFEPWFFSKGSENFLAEQTYHFGFDAITAGGWLASKLKDEYNMKTGSVGFSYDKNIYFPKENMKSPSKKKVFFYGRPSTERRAFEIGLLVLNRVCQLRTDVEVLFAGGDVARFKIEFPYETIGVADIKSLGDVYNSCDAALVLSFTNLSLLPLEIMACGVPVVSNNGANVEWLLTKENSCLVKADVESLAQGVVKVLSDSDYKDQIVNEGLKVAQATSWEAESQKMDQCLNELSKG